MTILTRHLSILTLTVLALVTFSFFTNSNAQTAPSGKIEAENKNTVDSKMSQQRMEDIVGELSNDFGGEPGAVQFTYDGVPMAMFSVPELNRMRIVAAVIKAEDMSEEHLYAMMISNYHLALDARYALGDGMVYSTFIHPLGELTAKQIESALRQVANLVRTFGTEYTSGELSFGQEARGQEI